MVGYRPPLDDDFQQEYRNGNSKTMMESTMADWEDSVQETFGYVVSSMWSIVAGGSDELFRHPQVQASLRNAGEKALNDPQVQSALVQAAQEHGPELAALVRDQVSTWATDPEVQKRAKHYASEAAKAAGQVISRAGQMFADQIAQGPAGLRVLAFCAGGTSLACCVLEMLHVESVLMGPSRYILSGFQGIFAVRTMLFEMPADWVAMVPGVTHYQEPLGWSPRSSMPAFCAYVALQDLIMDEARFMTRAGGRGLFYIFQGAIWACFASLLSVVHLAAAAAMLLVGTLHVLMQFGIMPQNVAQKIREKTGYDPEPPYLTEHGNSLHAHQSLGPVPNSSLPDGGFRDDPFLTGRKLPEANFERSAPALDPPMLPRGHEQEREAPETSAQGAPAHQDWYFIHLSSSKSQGDLMYFAIATLWEWPPWCLNFKSPNIEVWVLDEDAGVGRWVSAQPQSRVVDKAGRDAYLCAEYLWEAEYYVQDFGPQHVRRKGEARTVLQTLTQDDVELDTTKVFKKNGDEALMDTKVFKDKKKKEGGLMSLLED
eukprot:g33207.t1